MTKPKAPPPPVGKITDVRSVPKALGPIEELGTITIEDLRRLPGANIAEKTQKIAGKIELLGRESLVRKSQGLEAWKRSPLNQLYGKVVHETIVRRISPEEFLKQAPLLTAEEFHAIMELNQKLRF